MEGLKLDNLAERVEGIASSLLNLEINTVVKADMSAQKMPEVPMALIQLAETYTNLLTQRLPEELRDQIVRNEAFAAPTVNNGPDMFEALANAAEDVIGAIRQDDADLGGNGALLEWTALLVRVKTNSRQIARGLRVLAPAIQTIVDAIPSIAGRQLIGGSKDEVSDLLQGLKAPLPIPPDFTILVRKAWDLGDETILLQTTLQIDGDIVSRVSPAIFGSGGPVGLETDEERRFVSAIHHEAMAAATAQWKSMFQLLGELAKGLSSIIFSKI